MKIQITEEAFKWFHEEMDVEENESVRFFVRYGGSGGLQPGFSLGVTIDEPHEAAVSVEQDGVTYFIEETDLWYFDDHDLIVSIQSESEELSYQYE